MYDFKNEILSLVSINDILNHYGFSIRHKGFISCPFHSEKTASCRIYPETNTFYCFGCGAGGNIIDFVSRLENKSFYETLRIINHNFALNLPFDRQITVREKTEMQQRQKEREKQRQAERELTESVYADYWRKFDRYEELKNQRQIYQPTSDNGKLHPKFVESLLLLPLAEYELDIAESEVMKIANG